jgi:hypothetical protein
LLHYTNLETAIGIKLAAMDTKIENVLLSLQKTVELALKNSMTTFEAKITTMATGLLEAQSGTIVTQVATSMSGVNSPFVTADSLQPTAYTMSWKNSSTVSILASIPWPIPPIQSITMALPRPQTIQNPRFLRIQYPNGYPTITQK